LPYFVCPILQNMNKALFQKVLPHLLAIVIFLVVALIYCSPALQGKVVNSHDIASWQGANKQSLEFKEQHGHYPLWTNSLFSGMPTFLIAYDANNVVPWIVHRILTLGLPVPIQFFFLAAICFYFLAMVLRASPVVGILGALAFAYCTYNPVIISAGHDTKMWSIAYMPALLGSVLLIYEKKYWIGTGLTALFTAILIAMNHVQIDYYLAMTIFIMTIFYAVRWIKSGELKHFAMAAVLTLGAAAVGVLTNAVNLMSVYEYQKETIRHGGSELSDTLIAKNSETGVSRDYAMSYSLKITEPFVMFAAHMYGGADGKPTMDPEKSKTYEVLQSFPPQLQQQLGVDYYWGGLNETGLGTSGPPYIGAITIFLALLGVFLLDNKHKWWMLTTIAFAIMISWGSYFEGLSGFLYDNLPFYDKFRAPSMILVLPQLLFPILAVLTVQRVADEPNKKSLLKPFKKGIILTAAVFAVMLLIYISSSFSGRYDRELMQQVSQTGQTQLIQLINSFADALKEDRRSLMIGSIGRSFGFVLVAALILFAWIRNNLNRNAVVAGLTVLVLIDLLVIDSKYLNADDFVEKEDFKEFPMTQADQQIRQDTGYYRVFNIDPNRWQENVTSSFHNSIGGYHAAKLKIYQDLIEHQLSKNPPNMQVLNMLNAKYFIQTDRQTGQKQYSINPEAFGPAWLVKSIHYVPGPRQEMSALDSINVRETAIVQEAFKGSIPFEPQWDSTATISLVKNENDKINYSFSAASNQFAVFSEIYYKAGWKAFIDGQEAPIVRVNYVLRGLAVPSGQHNIEFRFEPQGYLTGRSLTTVASIILVLLLGLGIFLEWRNRSPKVAKA
jgi:Predicted membrane protein